MNESALKVPTYLALSWVLIVLSGEMLMGNWLHLGFLDALQFWNYPSPWIQLGWSTTAWGLIAAGTLAVSRHGFSPLAVAIVTFAAGLTAELSNAMWFHFFSYTPLWGRLAIPTALCPGGAALMFEANLLAAWLSRRSAG